MKYLFSIVPLLFLITSRSCDKKVEEVPTLNFGEVIELAYQDKMMVGDEGLAVTFQSVKDSRCPKGVQCIRAGEAKVELLMEQAGQSGKMMLEAKGLCPDREGKCGNSGSEMGYRIQLLSADPYPEEGQGKDVSKYTVRVKVTKGK